MKSTAGFFPWALFCTLCVLGCCHCAPAPEATSFIAFARDFESFRTWERFDLGNGELDGHGSGPRAVYLNRRPARGATEFPVGTLVVKAFEPGSEELWTLFAMVKRGADYNSLGAQGWEYFRLAFSQGTLVVLARGIDPDSDYFDPDNPTPTACNSCHGTSQAATNDFLLSAPLQLSRLAD